MEGTILFIIVIEQVFRDKVLFYLIFSKSLWFSVPVRYPILILVHVVVDAVGSIGAHVNAVTLGSIVSCRPRLPLMMQFYVFVTSGVPLLGAVHVQVAGPR